MSETTKPVAVKAPEWTREEAVAFAIRYEFTRSVEESSGKKFIETGVQLPEFSIWERYARAALDALSEAPAGDEEYTETCGICDEPFKLGDMCAIDIELGQSHAECLEGCPTVDLETSEEIEGPIANYPYEPDPASTQGRSALSEAPAPEKHVNVDELAQEIRRVDGSHSLGAGALAEALMPFLSRALTAATTEGSDNG